MSSRVRGGSFSGASVGYGAEVGLPGGTARQGRGRERDLAQRGAGEAGRRGRLS